MWLFIEQVSGFNIGVSRIICTNEMSMIWVKTKELKAKSKQAGNKGNVTNSLQFYIIIYCF